MKIHDIKVESVDAIKILLLGQIKSGKSSFLNTLATIDEERIAQITRAGGHGNSLTVEVSILCKIKHLRNLLISFRNYFLSNYTAYIKQT
jgi:ABC-type arginine transport system ATPase subunit